MTSVQAIFVRENIKKVHYSYILDLTNTKLLNINKTFAVYMLTRTRGTRRIPDVKYTFQ